jgi:D-tagatose-1,6-bisphosphate aldolase subunit GatZ/KbaZ
MLRGVLLSELLRSFLRTSRGVRGIYSVCSAHPWVIEAAICQAQEDGTHLLLEATSNQVNQSGGYTGMTPALFRDYVHDIALERGFDVQRLILGGDHLGPNPWQHLDAKAAMEHALDMVCMYVAAGFTKIHLDASMRCADDPAVLSDETMAERAASMCQAAESVRHELGLPALVYVIGTEVPTPGGADHALEGLEVTTRKDVERTLAVHRDAFHRLGLESAWEYVIAVVVQPGVEFDHDSIVDYDAAKAQPLQGFLHDHPELVMEAHSSDYQLPKADAELVRDGFSILKVGPALTFALREALYALAAMERELVPADAQSRLIETMDATMMEHPGDWQRYYRGDARERHLLRIYSYSDRIRYYWRFPEVAASVTRLIDTLGRTGMNEAMLSQYCPVQYAAIRAGELRCDPKEVVLARIRAVLKRYSDACLGPTRGGEAS